IDFGGTFLKSNMDSNINNWDFRNARDMQAMFKENSVFNNANTGINLFIPKATTLDEMFRLATSLAVPVSLTGKGQSVSLQYLFQETTSFNHPFSVTDLTIKSATAMFKSASVFDQNVNHLDFSSMDNVLGIFKEASSFNNGGVEPNWTLGFKSGGGGASYNMWDRSGLSGLYRGRVLCDNKEFLLQLGPTTNWNSALGGGAIRPNGCDWDFGAPAPTAEPTPAPTFSLCYVATIEELRDLRDAYGLPSYTKDCEFSQLDVSGLTNFDQALSGKNININVNAWDVSEATRMDQMFFANPVFNNEGQPLDMHVPNLEFANSMFRQASKLNVSVTLTGVDRLTVNEMFSEASEFVGPLNLPNGVKITSAYDMFFFAPKFDQNLNSWDFSECTTVEYMLSGATSFNNDGVLPNWDLTAAIEAGLVTDLWISSGVSRAFKRELLCVNNVTLLSQNPDLDWGLKFGGMTPTFDFDECINPIPAPTPAPACVVADNSALSSLGREYASGSYTHPCDFDQLDVSSMTNFDNAMSNMDVDVDINGWNVSQATQMEQMFFKNPGFNNDGTPLTMHVPNLENAHYMFSFAEKLNVSVTLTGVDRFDAFSMFYGASEFVGPLNLPDGVKITDAFQMFESVPKFDQNLNSWDFSECTDVSYMFNGATSFNNGGVLPNWDLTAAIQASSVNDMWRDSGVSTEFKTQLLCVNKEALLTKDPDFDWAGYFGGGLINFEFSECPAEPTANNDDDNNVALIAGSVSGGVVVVGGVSALFVFRSRGYGPLATPLIL
ncbi:MAG: BspA family leucine-rich repeat surface protein, partial [Limisphaerales bacterium]